jgi:hypothetical protein
MAISQEFEASQNKSIANLGSDALWFTIHSLLAVVLLGLVWGVITLAHPDPDSTSPKIFATALVFLIPMIGGFLIARTQRNHPHAGVARYVWISGLLLFAAVCVWVLDLPTGPGLCETCGPVEKLWRTFFDITHGSGLMHGDGLLVGTWVPLSMIGYAAGAALGLEV